MRAPTERFSDRVADYVRYRPSYPPEVIETIVDTSGVGPGSIVADIGSGTGIFSALLLSTGAKVLGIEPNEPMRIAALEYLKAQENFVSIQASAEQTGIESHSVDAITAAQAFHWFDRKMVYQEFKRILKPRGWVFLIWNDRKTSGSDFLNAYEAILQECAPEYAATRHQNTSDEELLAWYQNPNAQVLTFTNAQVIELDGLLGRAYSSSYVPEAETKGREIITQRLTDAFEIFQTDGKVSFEYETKVFLGRLE